MGQLKGGTTIAGYPAIHSGMKNVYLSGKVKIDSKENGYKLDVRQNSTSGGDGIGLINSSGDSLGFWVGSGGAVLETSGNHNIHLRPGGGSGNEILFEPGGNITTGGHLHIDGGANIQDTAAMPLRVIRTGSSANAGLEIAHTGSTKYLGIDSGGTLMFSSSADLSGTGNRIWHSGNDGAGSGLDADTVDGLHASNFLRSGTDTNTGYIRFSDYTGGIVGNYVSSYYRSVYAMDTAYMMNSATDLGNFYGLAMTHTNVGGQSKAGLGHQFLFVSGGSTDTAIGTGIWTSGNIDATGNINASGYIGGDRVVSSSGDSYSKIRIWGDSSTYAIGMMSGITYGSLNDYAMTFQMNNDADRGWLWRGADHTKAEGAMSLNMQGELYLQDHASVGSIETRTGNYHSIGTMMLIPTSGRVSVTSGGKYLDFGQARYYGGGYTDGDGIYCADGINIGGGSNISIWSESSEIEFYQGPQGSAKKAMYISTDGVPMVNNEKVKTQYVYPPESQGEYTTVSAGWHRIAQGSERNFGTITIFDVTGSHHELIQFTAGVAYAEMDGANLHVLAHTKYGTESTFGGIRLLYSGTYDTVYLDVHLIDGAQVRMYIEDTYPGWEWTPMNFEWGSVPAGYNEWRLDIEWGFENMIRNVLSGTALPAEGSAPGDIFVQY